MSQLETLGLLLLHPTVRLMALLKVWAHPHLCHLHPMSQKATSQAKRFTRGCSHLRGWQRAVGGGGGEGITGEDRWAGSVPNTTKLSSFDALFEQNVKKKKKIFRIPLSHIAKVGGAYWTHIKTGNLSWWNIKQGGLFAFILVLQNVVFPAPAHVSAVRSWIGNGPMTGAAVLTDYFSLFNAGPRVLPPTIKLRFFRCSPGPACTLMIEQRMHTPLTEQVTPQIIKHTYIH